MIIIIIIGIILLLGGWRGVTYMTRTPYISEAASKNVRRKGDDGHG